MNPPPSADRSEAAAVDARLVARARDGEFAAFDELVRRHERRLYALALSLVGEPADAEEVVQITFVAVLEGLDGFRGEASFATWASRIATHAALKVLRKRRGLPTVSLDAALEADDEGRIPHPEVIRDWGENPLETVERSELRHILQEAAANLSDALRTAFVLRDVQGLSTRETAEILGISESAVKVRLLRARLALREELTRTFGRGEALRPDHGPGAKGHEGRGTTDGAASRRPSRPEPGVDHAL